MGIREKMNNNPAITTGLTIFVIVAAIFAIYFFSCSGGPKKPSMNSYYTDDDGATYFPDLASKIPPFTDDKGKPAVHCFVYRCGGGSPFVAYLEKFSDETKKDLESQMGQGQLRPRGTDLREMKGHFYKKPGAANQWIDQGDSQNRQAIGEIMHVICPEGKEMEQVLPK